MYSSNNHNITSQLMRKFVDDKKTVRGLPLDLQKNNKNHEDVVDPVNVRKLWSIRNSETILSEDLDFVCEIPRSAVHLGIF